MIKTVAEEVAKLSPEHKVDLAKPDRTIMIELFKVGSKTRWSTKTLTPDRTGHLGCGGL